MLLSAPDSLVVSITKNPGVDSDEQPVTSSVSTPRKSRANSFGINGLDMLKFTYKVSFLVTLFHFLKLILVNLPICISTRITNK